jgi:hypothetical protein
VLQVQFRLNIDLGDPVRADPEVGIVAAGAEVGVLSPNDIRVEEGWPRSSDPTADSIEPPVAGGKPAGDATDEPAMPLPPPDDAEKIALLGPHRGRHA